MSNTPQPSDSVEAFCRDWLSPAIHLTAIGDDGRLHSKWFGADSSGATVWASERNKAQQNIYFAVNSVEAHLPKKASKSEVLSARYLHVDIDPPKDGAQLNKPEVIERLSGADTPPSVIIDSGNGIQALWKLEDQSLRMEEIEQANCALISKFAGDPACWNVDRILRLPGTTNWPNAKKRAAGRVPVPAELVATEPQSQISLEYLALLSARNAPAAPTPAAAIVTPHAHALPAGVSLLTADDLGLGGLDTLRHAIEHPSGMDRSKDGLSCARLMRTRGFSDKQIVGVLANPANAVHAHYAAQPNPIRNVLRTVEALDRPLDGYAVAGEVIAAKPFCPRDPKAIPRRPWIMDGWLLRNTLTGVLAPGGVGKSSFSIALAVALASGRDLFGKRIIGGPKRVWYWNLEDDGDELDRQFHAAMLCHDVDPTEVAGRLFCNSGPDGSTLCLAREGQKSVELDEGVIAAIEAEVERLGIDVVMIDPWVGAHQVDENSNSKIDPIVKRLAKAARSTGMAWLIVHHTAKPQKGEGVTVNSSRGASAFANAARIVLTLNRMMDSQGAPYGISGSDLRLYFRVTDDKHNRSAASSGIWCKMESVELGNGDSVGVATRWMPPSVAADTSPQVIREIQAKIAEGNFRANAQAHDWAGRMIAEHLGLDVTDKKAWRRRVAILIEGWIEKGYFKIEERLDNARKPKKFLVVGTVVPKEIEPANDGVLDFSPGVSDWGE